VCAYVRLILQQGCLLETNSRSEVMFPVRLVNVWGIIKVGDCSRQYHDSIYPSTVTTAMTGDRWTNHGKGAVRFRCFPLPGSKVLPFLWATLYNSDHFLAHYWLGVGEACKMVKNAQTPLFCIFPKTSHSDWSYECTPNTVNAFERATTLPGHSELSLAATTPCRLQLRSASTIFDHYYRLNFRHGDWST
jgi:hypothetical protein